MGGISLDRVSKVYEGGVVAVDDVSLEVGDGEFMVLVGPSGCGKSTLLRVIAGLEKVTAGTVSIGGEDVTAADPPDRDIAMVFQSYALYPHMTVRQNLAFGLRQRRAPREDIDRRVGEMARMLGLEELMARKPAALSGGQRQRVAIGRALVREPRAFLLDEPLSNLDAKLRTSMRSELARLHERLRVTTVYVTHDQIEAMTLGERVAVLRDGVIQQCDHPQVLYRSPRNLFVAAFIGSPAMNFVEAQLADGEARFAGQTIALPADSPLRHAERRVILGIRPGAFAVDGPRADPGWPAIEVDVDLVEHLGEEAHVSFVLDAPRVAGDALAAAATEAEDREGRLLADDESARFVARIDGRDAVAAGERARLRIDHTQLHVFDVETGEAVAAASRAHARA
jgi:multiple sugar transport system ATP-binding protein